MQENQYLREVYIEIVHIVKSVSSLVNKQKGIQKVADDASDWSHVSRKVREVDSTIELLLNQYEDLQEEVNGVRDKIRSLGGKSR